MNKFFKFSYCLLIFLVATLQLQAQYVLTNDDVVVEDGELRKCFYKGPDIIIPSYLDGQEVTSIASELFKDVVLKKVVFSEGLKKIGDRAFYGANLTSVVFPKGLKSIGEWAFYNNNITSVVFLEGLKSIGEWAFYNNNITSVVFPESLESIREGAFAGHYFYASAENNITSIVFPKSLKSIGSYAFRNNQIKSITFSKGLKSIGKRAFSGNGIRSVVFLDGLKSIGSYASPSTRLKNLKLPNSIVHVGAEAFASSVILPSPNTEGKWSVTSLPSPHPQYNEGDTVMIEEDFHYIISTPYTLTSDDVVVENGKIIEVSPKAIYTDITIPNFLDGQEVTGIGNSVFANYQTLTSITFPETLKSIGYQAFYDNDLTSIAFPEGLKSIGEEAFSSNQIVDVTFHEGLEEIKERAFYDNNLASVAFPQGLKSIGEEAFYRNNISDVTLPNSLRIIEENAFSENSITTYITLPSPTVEGYWRSSGDYGTDNRINLKDRYIYKYNSDTPYILSDDDVIMKGGTITEVALSVRYYSNIIIPNILDGREVTSIGNSAFQGHGLKKVILPESLKKIEREAFFGNALTNITFNEGLETIIDNAFRYNHLTNIAFPSSLKNIGDYAFANNRLLENITLPNNIEYIGDGAFVDNYIRNSDGSSRANFSLTINFPNSLLRIGKNVIDRREGDDLKIILPSPSMDGQWCSYSSQGKEIYLEGDTVSNLIEKIFITTEPYTLTDDNVVVENGQIIEVILAPYHTNIIIPNCLDGQKVTSIGNGVFHPYNLWHAGYYGPKHLRSVILPDGLKTIGDRAFDGNFINSINFPKGLTSIGNEAFEGSSLRSVVFPEGLKTIGDKAFKNNNLTEVTLSKGLEHIGLEAFGGNNNVQIPLPPLPESSNEEFTYHHWLGYSWILGSLNDIETIPSTNTAHRILSYYSYDVDYTTNDIAMVSILINGAENSIITLQGDYKEEIYNIQNNHSFIGKQGSEIIITPIKPGYTFTPKSITIDNLQNNVTHTFSASLTHNVTYHNVDEIYCKPIEYNSNTDSLILAPITNKGYIFEGWYRDVDFINHITALPKELTEDIDLYAKWKAIDYNITYHNIEVDDTAPVTYNIETDTITLPILKNEGYIVDWYKELSFINKIDKVVKGSTGDLDLYAKWRPEDYKITYHNVEVDDTFPVTYNIEADTITLPALIKDGFLVGWYTDSNFTNRVAKIPSGSVGDINLYAKWEVAYQITYHQAIHNNPTVYSNESETIILSKPTHNKYEYVFVAWFSDSDFTNEVIEIPSGSKGNIDLYAKWEVINYNIIYHDTKEARNINPTSYNYYTETFQLRYLFDEPEGYRFRYWSNTPVVGKITKIVKGSRGNIHLYAIWGKTYYNITYHHVGVNNSNPAGYDIESETIILSDLSKEGYTFEGWYSKSDFTDKITEIPQGSTGDMDLYAKWEVVDYTITYHNVDVDNSNPKRYTIETDTVTLSSLNKEGYTFEGWYTDEALTTAVTEIAKGSTGDIDLYAKWEVVQGLEISKQIINIYPNPTNKYFSLDLKTERIEIFNTSGKLIKIFTKNKEQYNISDLSSGVYILSVYTNGSIQKAKLMVE